MNEQCFVDRKFRPEKSVFSCSFQMVVVSDDVHEYAVALKDTEEKIARCPAKVRTVWLARANMN